MMNYTTALNCILKKQSLGIVPGLSRISKLLDKMGNPQEKLKIIHIAGTNGKGTVANNLASALNEKGFTVGLFTSPWIEDYREQIKINGAYIYKSVFSQYIEQYIDCDATEFELLTAIAYKYFYDSKVDYAVIECGLGGLNDSTNAFSNSVLSVITSVSIDHTNFLGNTLEEIALQKAGIIKNNSKVVLYPNPKCRNIFVKKCLETNSKLFDAFDTGDFYQNNIETVKTALTVLGMGNNFTPVTLPARQEYLAENIMIDGAHNPDGALALKKNLPDKKITAVIGMMKDKDVEKYLEILAPHFVKIITTEPSNPRAIPAEELKKIAEKYCNDVISVNNPLDAVKTGDFEFLLICGSFYLAKDVRKEFLPSKI